MEGRTPERQEFQKQLAKVMLRNTEKYQEKNWETTTTGRLVTSRLKSGGGGGKQKSSSGSVLSNMQMWAPWEPHWEKQAMPQHQGLKYKIFKNSDWIKSRKMLGLQWKAGGGGPHQSWAT